MVWLKEVAMVSLKEVWMPVFWLEEVWVPVFWLEETYCVQEDFWF